ncbi:histidine triad protein [Halomonas litopenaei]|uniref:Histidine triad protein n=1 Tax=Halomonas litopenaei TaxID=2109328 RepID=A0ABX5IZE0_9GAMM|nr:MULTISPECIES: HIT domain-containing protein [Halomonas]MBS8270157.1 HIT domain-containing protein [Halomonas litopenaei]PTL93167.1 histidine triad protein [Halomonas sp. SYSU XM8]PTL95929.1 histidine triad protein [Halomonas litopenaei]
MSDFVVDPRLVADSYPITELPLCQLRLMDDARYPWLMLIPRRAEVSEVYDLSEQDQQQLWREATRIGKALKAYASGDKLNIASLGNMVAQLHIHVIVRHQGDPAWPGPVWGQGQATPYDKDSLAATKDRILALAGGLSFKG